jgi:hypothetical protein
LPRKNLAGLILGQSFAKLNNLPRKAFGSALKVLMFHPAGIIHYSIFTFHLNRAAFRQMSVHLQPKGIPMITLLQLVPGWLRARVQTAPLTPPLKVADKKARQVLPTLPKPKPPPVLAQDDSSPPGYRLLWRI